VIEFEWKNFLTNSNDFVRFLDFASNYCIKISNRNGKINGNNYEMMNANYK
jgi:hypothetical protein